MYNLSPASKNKIRICLLLRSPKLKAYSIEEIFWSLTDYLNANSDGSYIVNILEVPEPSNSIQGIIRNINFVRKIDSDVIHITGDVHYLIPFLPKPAKKILTIHDLGGLKRMSRFSVKYLIFKWFWHTIPFRFANAVTVISRKTYFDLCSVIKDKYHKVDIIENYVKPVFRFTPKSIDPANPVFLLIGGGMHKNTTRSIQALKSIPGARINLLGKFDQTTFELIEKFKLPYVQYNDLSHPEVVELYVKSDIVLFPSLYEGFGMPVIEAQAVGRAVITSDRSPMKEIAGNSDCLVDPESVTAIEQKILQILHDEDFRNALIVKGLENVKRFSINRVAEQYLNVYSGNLKKVLPAVK